MRRLKKLMHLQGKTGFFTSGAQFLLVAQSLYLCAYHRFSYSCTYCTTERCFNLELYARLTADSLKLRYNAFRDGLCHCILHLTLQSWQNLLRIEDYPLHHTSEATHM